MSNTPCYLINGSSISAISPFDRGFAYGDGVFRTLPINHGLPDHWPLHYQKLVADCSAIGLVCPAPDLLMNDIQQLFSPHENAVVKIMITRGEGERGYALPAVSSPMRVVIKSARPQYPAAHVNEGVELHVCTCRLGHQAALAGVKHLNRLENVLARMEWNAPEIADGLLLDTQNQVIECTSANVFARFGQALVTPDLSLCGVAGVTRQRLLAMAHTLNLDPKIEAMTLLQLKSADDVIICNSLIGVWQVRKIQERGWAASALASQLREGLS